MADGEFIDWVRNLQTEDECPLLLFLQFTLSSYVWLIQPPQSHISVHESHVHGNTLG